MPTTACSYTLPMSRCGQWCHCRGAAALLAAASELIGLGQLPALQELATDSYPPFQIPKYPVQQGGLCDTSNSHGDLKYITDQTQHFIFRVAFTHFGLMMKEGFINLYDNPRTAQQERCIQSKHSTILVCTHALMRII